MCFECVKWITKKVLIFSDPVELSFSLGFKLKIPSNPTDRFYFILLYPILIITEIDAQDECLCLKIRWDVEM